MPLGIALVAPLVGAIQRADAPASPAPISSLADFFAVGPVFQDRNGDGVVDFVDARIALADKPTPGEIAAAADVAARFGFETAAMNLPVPRSVPSPGAAAAAEDGPTVFIGARALPKGAMSVDSLGPGLKPGDGLVAAFTRTGKPAIALLGGDDNGIAAAALMFAGHLPFVGDEKSLTTDKIADDVKQFLSAKGIVATAAAAPALYVRSGSDDVERLVVDVQLANGDSNFIKAQVALNHFKATASRDA